MMGAPQSSGTIPEPAAGDDEDVVWALQTAAVQWKRQAYADAIVWLRRAVESALDAGASDRAAELGRIADALSAGLLRPVDTRAAPVPPPQVTSRSLPRFPSVPAPPARPPVAEDVEEDAIEIDDDEVQAIDDDELMIQSERPSAKLPSFALSGLLEEDSDDGTDVLTLADMESAGLANDLGAEAGVVEDVSAEHIKSLPPSAPPAALDEVQIDVEVESRREEAVATPEPMDPSEPVASLVEALESAIHSRAVTDTLPDSAPEPAQPVARDAAVAEPASTPKASEEAEALPPPNQPRVLAEAEPSPAEPEPAASIVIRDISLATVRGLEDLPEESQVRLVRQARLETLGRDEEVSNFAVALVLNGSALIMPAIADAACAGAAKGDVVFTRGSLAQGVRLRVVAAQSGTVVAVWDDAIWDAVTADCPWVVDELRLIADHYQALAGVTMGAMGDRLDDALRGMVTEKCEVRALYAGDVLVEQGKPVGGLFIVGAGRVEVRQNDEVVDELGPGDFLFAEQVLSAGSAPATARAAKGGALVLFANRMAAHELMLSVPPLLEILAG